MSGILVSHLSHLGGVVALFTLVSRIIPSTPKRKHELAFITACLHTVSPAGLFLSAPYGESTFAFTTFLGVLFYVLAHDSKQPTQQSALATTTWTVLSGFCFALSTLFRSNGLLNGTIFLFDAIASLRTCFTAPSASNITHLLSTIIAGSLIAVGFTLPQAVAYLEYCTPEPTRPWCSYTIPSIYSWVQKHYWNVGFLAYWTPNNIPLFLLAAPVLAVLLITALAVLLEPKALLARIHISAESSTDRERKIFTRIIRQLAVPQIILAFMAVTSFHVQIINRISSGCALWYVVLAILMYDQSQTSRSGLLGVLEGKRTELVVKVMVAYAIVQGGLYAAFLPPA